MPFEFRLPDIGEGVAEGEVVRWFVKEGDPIAEDAPLVSVLTDKANVEIPSPKAGRIARLHAKEGDKVKVGEVLVTIDTGGGTAATPSGGAPASRAAAEESRAPPLPPLTPGPRAAGGAVQSPSGPAPGPESGRVLASPYVRRMAAERGIDLASVKGTGPAGRVLESDLPGTGAAPSVGAESRPQPPATSVRTSAAAAEAQRPAPESAVPTSRAPAAQRPAPSPAAPALPSAPGGPALVERIPLRGIRRVIADHLVESHHRAVHYTYVEEVDATELVRIRDRMAKHVEKNGLRLSYLPFVIKGVVAGLKQFPTVNARFDDERQELDVHKAYHIGIATATPEGLLVPVIHDADRKSVTDLAKEVQSLAEKGRAGTLTRTEMAGGTFTITSLGALGGVFATPILNYPEVAILGVHRIVRRPVYRADGQIVPADLLNLSVSLDHRVLDGFIGASFLSVVKSYLEDPHQLFAELA
jgi:pyruvate dehydrogenase E2 component (dihydrolipoamide acetyltransferase)